MINSFCQEKTALAKELQEKSNVLAGVKDKTKAYVEKLNKDKTAALAVLEDQVRPSVEKQTGAIFFFFIGPLLFLLLPFRLAGPDLVRVRWFLSDGRAFVPSGTLDTLLRWCRRATPLTLVRIRRPGA